MLQLDMMIIFWLGTIRLRFHLCKVIKSADHCFGFDFTRQDKREREREREREKERERERQRKWLYEYQTNIINTTSNITVLTAQFLFLHILLLSLFILLSFIIRGLQNQKLVASLMKMSVIRHHRIEFFMNNFNVDGQLYRLRREDAS